MLPHRIHVTLHDLGNVGEVAPELLKLALAAGDAVSAATFDVTYSHTMRFPSSGTYVLTGDMVVWTALEFMLIKSHVGKGMYDVLGGWPLRV